MAAAVFAVHGTALVVVLRTTWPPWVPEFLVAVAAALLAAAAMVFTNHRIVSARAAAARAAERAQAGNAMQQQSRVAAAATPAAAAAAAASPVDDFAASETASMGSGDSLATPASWVSRLTGFRSQGTRGSTRAPGPLPRPHLVAVPAGARMRAESTGSQGGLLPAATVASAAAAEEGPGPLPAGGAS